MERWYERSGETLVSPGEYYRAILSKRESGWSDRDFVVDLAARVIARYESAPASSLVLAAPPQHRTKLFYRRLFDGNGKYTRDFVTVASECLAAWSEERLEQATRIQGGRSLDTDPAFDVLALYEGPRLGLVSVKATEERLAENCALAAAKLGKLHAGYYDPELMNRLRALADAGGLQTDEDPAEMLFSAPRDYRIAAWHGEALGSQGLATRFSHHVPVVQADRRSMRLTHVPSWDEFWASVADEIYAQLT